MQWLEVLIYELADVAILLCGFQCMVYACMCSTVLVRANFHANFQRVQPASPTSIDRMGYYLGPIMEFS